MNEDNQKYTIYCHLASGEDPEKVTVNLQRFFWIQARNPWFDIKNDPSKQKKEYYAFVIILIGVSLSNLLGQNIAPEHNSKGQARTPGPLSALKILLSERANYALSPNFESDFKAEHIIKNFKELYNEFAQIIRIYDATRHFGPAKTNILHALNFDKVTYFMRVAKCIWESVINLKFAYNAPSDQLELFNEDFSS